MDYIVKISGEFKKGECRKCPASYQLKGYCNNEAIVWGKSCLFACKPENCPLEEVAVAENATTSEPGERKDLDE